MTRYTVYRKAFEMFKTKENVQSWLKKPNYALRGRTPKEYLKKESGRELLAEMLVRGKRKQLA